MPFNNRSTKSASASTGNRKFGGKAKPVNNFNMMSFGVAYLDEGNGKSVAKARVLLKSDEAKVGIVDEQGNTFTREEAATLLAEALLSGRGVSIYFFENNDGSCSGNARIDINGLDVEEAAPAPKQTKAAKPKSKPPVRSYPEITDEDDTEVDDEDDSQLPY